MKRMLLPLASVCLLLMLLTGCTGTKPNDQTGGNVSSTENGTVNGGAAKPNAGKPAQNPDADRAEPSVPNAPVTPPADSAPGNGTASPDDGTAENRPANGRSRTLPGMVGDAADEIADAVNGR